MATVPAPATRGAAMRCCAPQARAAAPPAPTRSAAQGHRLLAAPAAGWAASARVRPAPRTRMLSDSRSVRSRQTPAAEQQDRRGQRVELRRPHVEQHPQDGRRAEHDGGEPAEVGAVAVEHRHAGEAGSDDGQHHGQPVEVRSQHACGDRRDHRGQLEREPARPASRRRGGGECDERRRTPPSRRRSSGRRSTRWRPRRTTRRRRPRRPAHPSLPVPRPRRAARSRRTPRPSAGRRRCSTRR